MTSLTTPDNLVIWTVSDPDALSTASAAMQNSVQDALTASASARQIQSYKWPSTTARNAQAGMTAGDYGYQQDTQITYLYNGTTWKPWDSDWVAYNPTVTGISGGIKVFVYKWSSGVLKISGQFTLSGSAVTGAMTIALPPGVTLNTSVGTVYGSGLIVGGGTLYQIVVRSNNTTAVTVEAVNASTTFAAFSPISSTVPFSWTNGSVISLNCEMPVL